MVRCKNCGWENPNENAPCEKCGATLSAWTGEQPNIRIVPTKNLNVCKTAIGCPKCGYPLRPADSCCPNCNAKVEKTANRSTDGQPQNNLVPPPSYGGTVIAATDVLSEATSDDRRLVALLVTYSIRPQGDCFPVYEGKNFIGRGISANVSVPTDTKMSERHLSILYRAVDNRFKFKDEQSSNGTFINNTLQDEGELKSGDIITSGSTKFYFTIVPDF
jgi:hypothetical protein